MLGVWRAVRSQLSPAEMVPWQNRRQLLGESECMISCPLSLGHQVFESMAEAWINRCQLLCSYGMNDTEELWREVVTRVTWQKEGNLNDPLSRTSAPEN